MIIEGHVSILGPRSRGMVGARVVVWSGVGPCGRPGGGGIGPITPSPHLGRPQGSPPNTTPHHPRPYGRSVSVLLSPSLRIHSTNLRRLSNTCHSQQVCAHAQVCLLLLGLALHAMEGTGHNRFEAVVDLVLSPEKALQVLHPLEVAHRYAAGVRHDVRDYRNTAIGEDAVGIRGGWTIGSLND